jgi:hypothetical protein
MILHSNLWIFQGFFLLGIENIEKSILGWFGVSSVFWCVGKKNQWIWILGFESGSSKFGWIWVFQESIWKQHLTNTFGFSEDLDMFLFLCLFLSVCSFVVYFFICLFARLRVSGFFLGENSIDGSMFEGFPPVPVHEFPESLTGIY